MRSPRSRLETACRVGAFAILGWLLGNALIPDTTRHVDRASGATVAEHLAAWTRAPAATALHVTLDAPPEPWVIAWLGALHRSGHAVGWSGSIQPLAISAASLADPQGGIRVDVSAPRGSMVGVRDAAGVIDSVRVAGFGATLVSPLVVDHLSVTLGAQTATTPPPDSARIRPVLVIGAAGWEAKYIVAALEERGWPVVARFVVAPNVDVMQGAVLPLDTSRFSAVIAVDSTAGPYAAMIERFVRQGGGLVIAGRAGSAPALAALAPGVTNVRTHPVVHASDTLRLGTTGFYPVASLKSDAVPLERRDDTVVVAARRVGAGRLVQTGFDDTWRWRMAGEPGSERAHREWWSRVVAAVAYVPPAAAPRPFDAGIAGRAAPLADLVGRIGAARPERPAGSGFADARILILLMMILLLTEWASRRLRGLR